MTSVGAKAASHLSTLPQYERYERLRALSSPCSLKGTGVDVLAKPNDSYNQISTSES